MDEAKKGRTIARRRFNKAIKDLEFFFTTQSTKAVVESVVADLSTKYFALRDSNDELFEFAKDEDEIDEIEKYMDPAMGEFTTKTKVAQQYLQTLNASITETPVKAETKTSVRHMTGRLERLKLTVFNGNMRDYPTWKREFQHAMDKYGEDEEEQLQRLRETVSTQCPIKRELLSCATLPSAWSLLETRYGDQEELLALLLRDIKSYKPLKVNDSKTLRSFATAIRSFVTRVTDMGRPEESRSMYLFTDLLSKLCTEDQRAYCYHMISEKNPENVASLLDWLETQAKCRARGQSQTVQHTEKHVSHAYNWPIKCPLGCEDNHAIEDCDKFESASVEDRVNMVQDTRLCFLCLKRGHPVKSCFTKTRCSKCKKKHHDMLHLDDAVRPPSTSSIAASTTTSNASEGETNQLQSSFAESCCTLLPYVVVHIHDDNGTTHEALAMVDSGSTQTLVRKSFADKLKLAGESRLLTLTVAGGGKVVERSRLINLELSPVDKPQDKHRVAAFALKSPCSPAPRISKQTLQRFSHVKGIVDDLHFRGGVMETQRPR